MESNPYGYSPAGLRYVVSYRLRFTTILFDSIETTVNPSSYICAMDPRVHLRFLQSLPYDHDFVSAETRGWCSVDIQFEIVAEST